jgi:antitoxin YefM
MRSKSAKELRDPSGCSDRSGEGRPRVPFDHARAGKALAVLMSLEDFASYEEMAYLLRSPCNAERHLKVIENLDAGGGVERPLIE